MYMYMYIVTKNKKEPNSFLDQNVLENKYT